MRPEDRQPVRGTDDNKVRSYKDFSEEKEETEIYKDQRERKGEKFALVAKLFVLFRGKKG